MTDYKSLFEQAVRTLAAIDEALGIGDDGCGDPEQTLYAIAELKAKVGAGKTATVTKEMNDAAKRAEWVYGQPMAPCPACGSYNMKPQIPIAMETTGDEAMPQLVGKWARATKAGATQLQGPAYYCCWDCGHKGPAVDCTGRTSEECRADRALNTEMKRLWNEQKPHNAGIHRAAEGRPVE